MLSRTVSSGIAGIDAQTVEVEVDIIKGLPHFTIVGLPDSVIKESRERIRSAIENSGFEFPPKNFIVNLAPADFKKQGANYDLPIAISILHATGQIISNPIIPMVGELSLDGSVKPVRGTIAMAISIMKNGFSSIIVPFENRDEAAAIDTITVYPVKNIHEAIEVLKGNSHPHVCDVKEKPLDITPDFAEVKGQETAKRALEIAAAGSHNILLYGAPGSGKTMLAKRIPSILPPLTREQAIETTLIHSIGGKLKPRTGIITTPPFRSPHHTASDVALVGGGQVPNVGEITLSHNGILFLDEFVEFRNNVIQSLRQPLEDCEITVSRAAATYNFPADFMLIAASNPCQCGYLFDDSISCSCSPHKVMNYFQKIAGPILDRIDIETLVNRVKYKDLARITTDESSESIRERIMEARALQDKRFRGSTTKNNSKMTQEEVDNYCQLSEDSRLLLESAMKNHFLTARSYYKIIKVSRTIADLSGSDSINKGHLLEALSYKNLQRNYSRYG